MVTKNDIKAALDKYERERSGWKVGMFGTPVDMVTTPFCRDLDYFYNNTLKHYPENEKLSPAHIERLQTMLMEEVELNSTNSAVVDLYKNIYNLVNAKSEMAILR